MRIRHWRWQEGTGTVVAELHALKEREELAAITPLHEHVARPSRLEDLERDGNIQVTH